MKNKKSLLTVLLFSTVLIILIPFILYLSKFNGRLSVNNQDWANFGSFYGGIVSSIFAALSFIIVLIIFSNEIQNKTNDKIDSNILKYLDVLSSRYQKISVNINNQKIIGTDVFNQFNVYAMKISELSQNFASDVGNVDLKNELNGLYLTSVFIKNSIREYLKLVIITFNYIEKHNRKEIYQPLLSACLSEQEGMSCAILKYSEISQNNTLKEFIESLEVGPVDGWHQIGKNYERAAKQLS